MPAPPRYSFGPDVTWSCEDVETVATTPGTQLSVTSPARDAMADARQALQHLRDADQPIYGVTTGFGPLVAFDASEDGPERTHADGLLAHLSTGAGEYASPEVVRAMITARLQAVTQGRSALRPEPVDALIGLLHDRIVPAVPVIGSLGASGDLTPLAHVARVLTGDGTVLNPDGTTRPARDALADAGRAPLALDGRDALGLVNGTSFMTGIAALTVVRAQRLLEHAEALTGWAFRLLGCRLDPLADALHQARGHAGQIESARRIRAYASDDSDDPDAAAGANGTSDRPLQEVYSLRCAPQFLGAVRDEIRTARTTVETELNGVNDNPLFFADPARVIHGGNFQGQQIAFAADRLNAAITQMGVLAERQVDVLLKPKQNGGAPPLLAWTPGTTSGLAGAQLTATALVAEMRQGAQMTSTSSIPTNGDNQDVVSMGATAARAAFAQTDHLARILAVLSLSLSQLTHLRAEERADGPAPSPPPWMPSVDPVIQDRPLHDEIATLAAHWLTPHR